MSVKKCQRAKNTAVIIRHTDHE